MGVVGILSTQLVHRHFIENCPEATAPPTIRTVIDRVGAAVSSA
jgi:hypothetical protein